MGTLLFLISLCGLCLLGWKAVGIREHALKATLSYCERAEVQLLDQSIALRGVWLKRDQQGQIRVWRSYSFEFTVSGEERYQGRTVLLGRTLQNITLEPHRFPH
jgi:hypothetical protein